VLKRWAKLCRSARRDWSVVGSGAIGVPGLHSPLCRSATSVGHPAKQDCSLFGERRVVHPANVARGFLGRYRIPQRICYHERIGEMACPNM
jgi:hypothetical protein